MYLCFMTVVLGRNHDHDPVSPTRTTIKTGEKIRKKKLTGNLVPRPEQLLQHGSN